MDKQSFISYIKTLGISEKVENAVLSYIEANEFGDKTVQGVVDILEAAADQADIAVEELDKVVEEMEKLKDELSEEASNYEVMGDSTQDKCMNDISSLMDQETAQITVQDQMPESPVAVTGPVSDKGDNQAQEKEPLSVVQPWEQSLDKMIDPPAPVVEEALPPVGVPVTTEMSFGGLPQTNDVTPPVAFQPEPRLPEQPSIMGEEPVVTPAVNQGGLAPDPQTPAY